MNGRRPQHSNTPTLQHFSALLSHLKLNLDEPFGIRRRPNDTQGRPGYSSREQGSAYGQAHGHDGDDHFIVQTLSVDLTRETTYADDPDILIAGDLAQGRVDRTNIAFHEANVGIRKFCERPRSKDPGGLGVGPRFWVVRVEIKIVP